MAFCLDTCSLIDLRTRHYPPDLFPSLWEVIDEKASDGSLIVADEVLVEVRKKDDDLLKWLKDRSEMVIPTTEEVQGSVIEILDRFPRLVNTQKGRSQADPFVVATAIQEGATVVTSEARGSARRPKIPLVSESFDVPWIGTLSLLRQLGVRL